VEKHRAGQNLFDMEKGTVLLEGFGTEWGAIRAILLEGVAMRREQSEDICR